MAFIDDKQNIVTGLNILEILNELPKKKAISSLESVNSKDKNLIQFIIDLLSLTCRDSSTNPKDRGRCEASRILTEILTQFFPALIRILKEGIIKAIKAGLMCGSDFTVPNIELKIKMSELDYNGLLKLNPNSPNGSLFYGRNSSTDINWFLYNLIQNGGSSNWGNIFDFTFDQSNEELNIKTTSNVQNQKFEEFLTKYLDSIELFSSSNFLTRLTDNLTGSLTSNLFPSLENIINQEKTNKVIEKINNTDTCEAEYEVSDNYFVFSNDELFEIENTSTQKFAGATNLDLGCGTFSSTISADTFKVIFDNIKNANPNQISQVIEESITTINLNLTSNVGDADKNVASNSLNLKMIKSIPLVLSNVIFEPKIVLLYLMSLKMVKGPLNNDTPNLSVKNSFDFSSASKVFFEFVVRESLAALLEILYNQLKKEILNLLILTTTSIVKEQLKLKYKILSGSLSTTNSPIPQP